MFKFYNNLGFHNPYYFFVNNKLIIDGSFKNILENLENHNVLLDFEGLIEAFCTGFCFGDRTLVKGISKTPWMARPNKNSTDWEYYDVPKHGLIEKDQNEIAKHFYNLLENELIQYVSEYQNIGILLTGGMDSRIVAIVLNNAIKLGKLLNKSVFAYTWGNKNSRDVIYASEIAKIYNWKWKHLEVDQDQMRENIEYGISEGAEFSPIHLHAMSKLTQENYLDCVLAGSFGDSVGRAEFSGRKVQDLNSIENKIINFGGLIRDDLFYKSKENIVNDINKYHIIFPEKELYQQFEVDQQLHYMRRMLNACMNIINNKIPLFQMFGSPEVFGYMWSIHPDLRNDLIYKLIIDNYGRELINIPWARTGLIFPNKEGTPDNHKKSHHNYGEMIRTSFLLEIKEYFISKDEILSKIFNSRNVFGLIKNLESFPIRNSHIFEEKLIYIYQVIKFIDKYKINIPYSRYRGKISSYLKEDIKYKIRYYYKSKIK